MISETIAIVCLFVIVAIFFLKAFSLSQKAIMKREAVYSNEWILLLFAVTVVCWFFYFVSLMSMISSETTITDGTDTFVVSSTSYVALASYGLFVNILVFFTFILTLAETILLAPQLLFSYIPRGKRKR